VPIELSRRKFTISGKHPDGRQLLDEFLGTEQEAEIRRSKLEEDGFIVEMKRANRSFYG
jgi:hypothetical protein